MPKKSPPKPSENTISPRIRIRGTKLDLLGQVSTSDVQRFSFAKSATKTRSFGSHTVYFGQEAAKGMVEMVQTGVDTVVEKGMETTMAAGKMTLQVSEKMYEQTRDILRLDSEQRRKRREIERKKKLNKKEKKLRMIADRKWLMEVRIYGAVGCRAANMRNVILKLICEEESLETSQSVKVSFCLDGVL